MSDVITTTSVQDATALFAESEVYRVNLDSFEGPLDLLLYLIKQNDMDIANIQISLITEQYLKFIDDMKTVDVDLAGEFIMLAAELMQIKSQMLLPQAVNPEADEPDPRADLMRRLLEYQCYKEASQTLLARDQLERDVFLPLDPERLPRGVEGPIDGNVFQLMTAFQKILKKVPQNRYHEVHIDRISVNSRIMVIVEDLKVKRMMTLEQMLPAEPTKFDVVVTFLALLEMGRLHMIQIHQAGVKESIYVTAILETITSEEANQLIAQEAQSFDYRRDHAEGESHGEDSGRDDDTAQ